LSKMFLLAFTDWQEVFNYPGLELWKFINLAIFLTAAIIVLRKPLASALTARREAIRNEIQTALDDKKAAELSLAEADGLIARLSTDVKAVRDHAQEEARLERERQATAADQEIEKLKSQADRELETARKAAKKGLRQFLATRSVELATVSVVNQINADDDMRIIKDSVAELGRARS